MGFLSKKLDKINDPGLAGGGLVFIYSKQPIDSPSYYQTAEALALFMPRQSVSLFAQYRMTNQTLFSQSEMFGILQGADQVSTLLSIIRP